MLDLGNNLFNSLELHRYLDVSDLPGHIRFHGNCWSINKTDLHDGEAIICARLLFNPSLSYCKSAALTFTNGIVTAISSHSRSYYLVLFSISYSYSIDWRGFSVRNGTSVLLKFSCLQQVDNYNGFIHVEY